MRDLYRPLGLSPGCTEAQIRDALRNAPSHGTTVASAAAILLNPRRRPQYDRVHRAVSHIAKMRSETGLTQTEFAQRHEATFCVPRRDDLRINRRPAPPTSPIEAPSSRRLGMGNLALMAACLAALGMFLFRDSLGPTKSETAAGRPWENYRAKPEQSSPDNSITAAPVQSARPAPSVSNANRVQDVRQVIKPSQGPKSQQTGRLAVQSAELQAEPLPPTGAFDTSSSTSRTAIIVRTRKDGPHTFVKIAREDGTEAARGFIRAGEKHTFKLPFGTYILKTARGEQWFGEDFLFGPETTYGRADDKFPLQQRGDQWTVELIPQRQGNLREVPISASQF
jgi:hypothetical protein